MPNEPALPVDTVTDLLTNALVDAGIVGIDEPIEQPVLNRAFRQLNWLLVQWQRKRWLVYRLNTVAVTSTGAQTYGVGLGQPFNVNPRPDRIESGFLRLLNNPLPGGQNVDLPLDIIPSREDYNRITLKNLGTLAWRVYYDPAWPVGQVFPWPIPQASIYAIHLSFKEVLARFQSVQQPINLPPEYEAAMNFCLARRLRATYQMPPDPEITQLARDALNVIREANISVPTLTMPNALRTRQRAYDYRSDS